MRDEAIPALVHAAGPVAIHAYAAFLERGWLALQREAMAGLRSGLVKQWERIAEGRASLQAPGRGRF